MLSNINCIIDSGFGVYIPQMFAEELTSGVYKTSEYNADDIDTLLTGPTIENEWYWDAWNDTINNIVLFDDNGKEYFLYQDGDLFAVASDTPEPELNDFMGL